MKTRRMAGAALAALAVALWSTAPAAQGIGESQTGYFGSGHEAGQEPAPAPALALERA